MADRRAVRIFSGVRLFAAFLAVVLVAGCGAFEEPDGGAALSTHSRTRYTAKGDDKPHPGVARARRHAVQGIDVSRYQGRIDWPTVRAAGTRFAFIKATEGGDHLDPSFMVNWQGAKAAGVPRSAYHFVWWCRPAAEQAAWYIRNVPRDPSALPPVIDAEWAHGPNCRRKVSREDAQAKLRIISDMLTAHYGKVPIIYTDINFHKDVLVGVRMPNPFWLRAVAAEPHERYTNRRWTFWQFTQTGRVPGIRGHVDRNAFYGTDADWEAFVASGCDPRDHGRLPGCGYTRSNQLVASLARQPDPVLAPPPPPPPVVAVVAPAPLPPPPVPVAFVPQPAPATLGQPEDLSAFIEQLMPPGEATLAEFSDE